MWLVWIYLSVVNVIALALMGIDKRRAVRHRWRIREVSLFAPALLGGSLGSLLGMLLFNHKKHKKMFLFGVPTTLVLHIGLLIVIVRVIL